MKSDQQLVSFEQREGYLLIRGHGVRNSIQSISKASEITYAKVLETKSRYLLIDYRVVTGKLPKTEAFNLIRKYESSMPFFGLAVAACVFGEGSMEFAQYWQQIGRQRGFDINLFPTLKEAEQWLLNKIRESVK